MVFTRVVIADGGEGFARALRRAGGGSVRHVQTQNALGRPCRASYVVFPDGQTAALDLAAASGLAQIPLKQRDVTRASTFGSGLMLQRMFRAGIKHVLVGLGGSATNDGGIGLAAALGYRFLDRAGQPIPLTGAGLKRLQVIEAPRRRQWPQITAAVDVDNPLFGRKGAAYQFAPQKGASPAEMRQLDAGLRQLARVTKKCLGKNHAMRPGAGAAGGCGFGLITFLDAALEPGFEILRRKLGLDRLVREADLVVTGEGCLDATSLAGKAPYRLALLARKNRRPVWGVFGRIKLDRADKIFNRTVALPSGGGKRDIASSRGAVHHGRNVQAAAAALAKSA